MKRTHAAAIAVLLGVAGAAGTVAATRTAGLGASSAQPKLTERQIAQRSLKLDAFEASLRRSLAERPPALPLVPRYAASSPAPVSSAPAPVSSAPTPVAAAAVTQKIVYRRPAPIVVTTPRSGGETEEHEGREDESHEAEGQGHGEPEEGEEEDDD